MKLIKKEIVCPTLESNDYLDGIRLPNITSDFFLEFWTHMIMIYLQKKLGKESLHIRLGVSLSFTF